MTQDPDLFTLEKIATHRREDAKPLTKFLFAATGVYHIGVRRELRGARSNLIDRAYYVCKCNGKQLLYDGSKELNELPDHKITRCRRCFGDEGGYR
jgi:hypothetical protein